MKKKNQLNLVSKMDSILISKKDNHYVVIQGDKSSSELGYDEMLGLIVALSMPKERPCLNWMKTQKQHQDYADYLETIRAKKNNEVDFEETKSELNET